VWQFRSSQSDFYQKYQVARSIVDAPTSRSDKEPVVVAVPSTMATTKAA
jgi:hypothetical protein